MESLLGFKDEEEAVDYETTSSSSSSYSHKLVPWLSWDEWLLVSQALFSDSPDSIASGLTRITAWRSRGSLPALIEVTASIIEIQQKDPHFRKDQSNDDALESYKAAQSSQSSLSEEMLAMLYCMAIMRLVNCVVEKTRKKNEISIAEAADAIGIPRSLIDIRHEGSHRELPALQVVQSASIKAIDWLKYYYWEPQKNAIPFQGTGSAIIRNEIKSKFNELAFCLRAKMTSPSHSSQVKKRRGYKKDVTKILKSIVGLYSSFSSEVVSALLELLLNTKKSSVSSDPPTTLNEWKLVITKFSNKKPDFLLALLNAVLNMIETQEALMGRGVHTLTDCGAEIGQVDHLSSIFTWLVGNFEGVKPTEEDSASGVKVSSAEKTLSKAVLIDVLRKCLLVSASANRKLMDSALYLARLTGDDFLVQKVKKLSFLVSSNLDATGENASRVNSNSIFVQQEKSISQAAKKLEFIKHHQMKQRVVKRNRDDVEGSQRWVVAKSWTRCPIGMLATAVGYSGCLPDLDFICVSEKVPEVLVGEEKLEKNLCSGKIEASCDNPCVKKMRETVNESVSDEEDVVSSEGVIGHLMIGGVWKKVGEEEILAIKSAVRILV